MIMLFVSMKILISTFNQRLINVHINISDINRKQSNQPENAGGILNSSKDDHNSQGNCSTFALTVIPNSYNFNLLPLR